MVRFLGLTVSLLLAFAVLVRGAIASEIWEGASHGASPDEIRTLFPSVRDYDGEVDLREIPTLLVLDDVQITDQIADLAFEAEFGFAGESLALVSITNREEMERRKAKKVCSELTEHLRSQFGAPASETGSKSILSNQFAAYEFLETGRRISLTCNFDKASLIRFRVDYRIPALLPGSGAPHGLRMGMTYADLEGYLPELPEDVELGLDGREDLVVHDVVLTRSPAPEDPESFAVKIRISNLGGVCAVSASLVKPMGSVLDDDHFRALGRILPDQLIYGFYDTSTEDFGMGSIPFKIPGTTMWTPMKVGGMKFLKTWLTSETDPLPGNVDRIDGVTASGKDGDGKTLMLFRTKYRFSNYRRCGLGKEWDEF